MHSWIDGKKFIDLESFSLINFMSKHSYSFNKSRFELKTVNHLPITEKEELEGDIDIPSKLLKNLILKRYYIKEGNSGFLIQTLSSLTKAACTKIFTSPPPLVNVNCLMNTEIKQKQAIWNSHFGRKLINGKTINEKPIKSKVAVQLKPLKKKCEKVADSKRNEFKSKKKQVIKKNTEPVLNFSLKNKEKKCKETIKKGQDSLETKIGSMQHVQKTNSNLQNSVNIRTPLSKPSYENLSTPSFCKDQKFLTEFVEQILNNDPEFVACDHCNETFQDVKELYEHKKQHTTKKEICLLCEKVFYNPRNFTQHLLTHESVDSFSCKKCKKYFPSLKKFNQHCKEYHVTSSQYSFRRI